MWPVSARYMARYRESKVRHFRLVVLDPLSLSEVGVLESSTAVVTSGSISAAAGLYERTCTLQAVMVAPLTDPIGLVLRLDCGFNLPGLTSDIGEVEWVPLITMVVDDLEVDFTREEDDSRGAAIEQLMADHALTVRCRPNGVLEVRPYVEVNDRGVAVVIESGEDGTLVSGTTAYTQKGRFNRVIVVGEAPDFDPVRAEARDMDPLSPTYNPTDGSGPSGDRVAPIERSSDIRTYDQAYERAKQLLEEYTLVSEIITVNAVSLPPLDINDRITAKNNETDLAYDLVVDSIDWPLGTGLMSVSGRRVRALFP